MPHSHQRVGGSIYCAPPRQGKRKLRGQWGHLIHREHEWSETHGLDCGPYERCYQEWWECSVCGEPFTDEEAEALCVE